MAIEAGLCETVVCVHARNQATAKELPRRGGIRDGYEDFDEPYGFFGAVANHAFIASRHMHNYGTTGEQLGAVAVAARKHALLNPTATMKKPMAVADHQASRWIAEPLRLFDCSLVSDGGGAYLVMSAARARDLKKKPVYILGMGQHHPHASVVQADELSTLGSARSSKRAYAMSGLKPEDMDFAQIIRLFHHHHPGNLGGLRFLPQGRGRSFRGGGSN